jgi:hypothetical protein
MMLRATRPRYEESAHLSTRFKPIDLPAEIDLQLGCFNQLVYLTVMREVGARFGARHHNGIGLEEADQEGIDVL